jgi:hypothetical protein
MTEVRDRTKVNATHTYKRALAQGFIRKPREHTLVRHGLLEWWNEREQQKSQKAEEHTDHGTKTTIKEDNGVTIQT